MKILFVANTSWYLYNFRKPLLIELRNKGFEVHAASPFDSYTIKLNKIGVITHNIKISRSSISPFGDIYLALSLLILYKKLLPNIIHHFTIKPVIWGSFVLSFFPKINVVNSIPGLGIVFKDNTILKSIVTMLYRFGLKDRFKIIFQNPNDRKLFIDNKIVSNNQSHLILSSGVDVEYYKKNAKRRTKRIKYFGIMSRLLWSKGINEFVEASHIIYSEYSDIKFIILGSPDYGSKNSISHEWLENIDKNYEYIEWIKHKADVRPFLEQIDVFVLPSYYPEGIPKSLIESASFGLPLITTDTPGCREVVKNNYNGYLIKPMDINELTKSMKKIVLNPNLLEEFGNNSRKLALKKFDVKIVNNQTIDLYNF